METINEGWFRPAVHEDDRRAPPNPTWSRLRDGWRALPNRYGAIRKHVLSSSRHDRTAGGHVRRELGRIPTDPFGHGSDPLTHGLGTARRDQPALMAPFNARPRT